MKTSLFKSEQMPLNHEKRNLENTIISVRYHRIVFALILVLLF